MLGHSRKVTENANVVYSAMQKRQTQFQELLEKKWKNKTYPNDCANTFGEVIEYNAQFCSLNLKR